MKDLRITKDGDLYLSPITGDVEITDSIPQAIIIRLKWFLNEWRMRPDFGLPYYEEVFVKNPSTSLFASRIRKEILSVEGVVSVDSLTVDLDKSTRKCDVSFKCTIEDGADITQVAEEVVIDV
ncbi:MAG: GPW/gp25 family protein [Clostridia bacterium]|nr:GPW/gp25 family protein [Clostridia bacterium]